MDKAIKNGQSRDSTKTIQDRNIEKMSNMDKAITSGQSRDSRKTIQYRKLKR